MSLHLLQVQADYEYYRAEVRKIVENVIKPRSEQTDREGIFPRENMQALAEAGWNGVLIPEQWGGLGLGHVAFAIAAEEIAKGCASTSLVYVMHVGAVQTIALYGNEDQKERWLKPVRQGLIGTYSTSEKASGGHWWYNFSEAARHGEEYILNAEKSFTTSAGQADFYVFQTKSPGAQKPTDISFFIIDGKLPGISPGVWDALGVRGNHSGSIRYENVRVHSRDRLGEEGQGKEILESGVSPIYLIGLGSTWLGVAEAALEAATQYAKGTIHKDFNKRLADYQVIRQQLAEVKVLIESLKPWQIHLAQQLDTLQKEGRPQVELLLPLVEFKIHAAEVANKAARVALDVSGGYGYKRGIFERLYRDARAGIAMGPSNNIAREWIGKALVGLPLELWFEGGE
jgi:alkylation response protein AidB-like acyl-CoA dehydrogenase